MFGEKLEMQRTKETEPSEKEFEELKNKGILVPQGWGKISHENEGGILWSDGMSKCYALFLKDSSSGEVAFFHIDNLDLNGDQEKVMWEFMQKFLERQLGDSPEKEQIFAAAKDVTRYRYPKTMKLEEFQAKMEELNESGILRAGFAVGTGGEGLRDRAERSILGFLGIKIHKNIIVDSGGWHWEIVFDSRNDEVHTKSKEAGKNGKIKTEIRKFNF